MNSIPPPISIVIPCYNSYEDLKEGIQSILKNDFPREKYEIIVVDDFSIDNTYEIIKSFPDIKVIRNNKNMGASYSRNIGVKNSNFEFIAFTDSDAIVPEDWLKTISKNVNENTILTGEVINYYNNNIEFEPRYSTFLGGSIKTSIERANVANSCNLVISKKIWNDINGFDENIRVYFEDSDFGIRARQSGYKVTFLPELVVRHKHETKKTGQRIYLHTLNRTYAMLKNYRKNKIKMLLFLILNTLYALILSFSFLLQCDLESSYLVLKAIIEGIGKFLHYKYNDRIPSSI